MDSVTSYAKKVVAGKIIAGDSVKKACKQNIVLHSLKITADTAKESGQASH